jgi:membrane fusion protein, copper/silver efflux system
MGRPAKIGLICSLMVGSFLVGSWFSRRSASADAGSSARRVLYYQDPMHPAYKSDKPGVAPDCGMQLEPVYAGEGGAGSQGARERMPPGAVEISPERQQLIGVRVAEVTTSLASKTVRVVGRVALDETRIVNVSAAVDGWVRQTAPVAVGDLVGKDQVLGTFYNREFLTAQQTYLYALNTMDRFKKEGENADQLKLTSAQVRAAEENLEYLGMGEAQMREVARTRQIARNIDLRSPVDGVVLARNLSPELRFDRGTQLFSVGDLRHVWVLADLFGNEARFVRPGQAARVTIPGQGVSLPAKFSEALPRFDASTRALRARLELDNPRYQLRPDMFVDVQLDVTLGPGIILPADAIVDTGLRKTVFVDRGNGFFEPREVEAGARLGDRVQIAKGLQPGDRIVVSGNFLIDSESRMKLAAARQDATTKDPVCGMDVDPTQAGNRKSAYQGRTYYFCMDECKRKFDQNPESYLKQIAGPRHD